MAKDSPRELILLRHAKSAWDTDATTDFDRPLAKRGDRDAPRMGAWLAGRDLCPDHVVSSPAKRAEQTARAVLGAMGQGDEAIEWDERLYDASVDDLLEVLRDCPERCRRVMLVGHCPGLLDLAEHLTGETIGAPRGTKPFPTGAAALLRIPVAWRALGPASAELVWVVRPRSLPAAG